MKRTFKKFGLVIVCIALITLISLPLAACDLNALTGKVTESPNPIAHLIAEAQKEAAPVRYIDSVEAQSMSVHNDTSTTSTEYFRRQTELYNLVVNERKRPVFAQGDPLEAVYTSALAVLDRYILNDMTPYERVHTVHDYLVSEITYNQSLYDDYLSGNGTATSDNNDSFNLSGVLIKKLAVCDGISKSAAFLLAIEGITAVRVTGNYYVGVNPVPHAWNKVELNLTGSPKWYAFDATMDRQHYTVSDGSSGTVSANVVYSHGLFLRSDEVFDRTHIRDQNQPFDHAADEDFDYFADKYAYINGEFYKLEVKTYEELDNIFKAIAAAKRAVGKIELKLKITPATDYNFDAYLNQAYSNILSPDFSASGRPWTQSGADVVMCLIYM